MNKFVTNNGAKKIYDKWSKEKERIEKDARDKGIWSDNGFDSNNYLFKKLNEETKEELKKLISKND